MALLFPVEREITLPADAPYYVVHNAKHQILRIHYGAAAPFHMLPFEVQLFVQEGTTFSPCPNIFELIERTTS